MSKHPIIYFLVFIFFITTSKAQQKQDSVFENATLQECVQYALTHRPEINQSLLDEKIVNAEIKTRLADWYPQLSLNYTIQHYFKTPVSISNGTTFSTTPKNFSTAYFSLNQNIFNPDVLLASKTASEVRTQASQFTANNKIYIILDVSKAFYDVLLSQQQINLVDQDIARLDRTVKDSYNQYKAGVVDKTDYKRAQISLNNAIAEKKQYDRSINCKIFCVEIIDGLSAAILLLI